MALNLALGVAFAAPQAVAADAVAEMAAYLDFLDYGGGVVAARQILPDDWRVLYVVDARSPLQYASGRIPGAVNMEWRQLLARRQELPRDRLVLLYCETGMLSAQAHFALRVAGHDNVRVLQGGLTAWKAEGGPLDQPERLP